MTDMARREAYGAMKRGNKLPGTWNVFEVSLVLGYLRAMRQTISTYEVDVSQPTEGNALDLTKTVDPVVQERYRSPRRVWHWCRSHIRDNVGVTHRGGRER